jgi:polar amino acid transport system substrate-binding protein
VYILTFVLVFNFSLSQNNHPRGIIKWAADAEGNAPYIIPDPKNQSVNIGFEVDIANAIARELGMTAEFVQNQWDGLIPGLQNGNYHMAINGLEITEDRKMEVNFSVPYYITFEQIIVMKDRNDINSMSDLVGKKCGALKGALSERILNAKGGIEVVTYDGEVLALTDMAIGRLDAVLCDAPIAIYYGEPDPRFKLVGQPIGEIEYGIAIRKSDTVLLKKVNQAIQKLIEKGELRKIYEEWNLWNYMMANFTKDKNVSNVPHKNYDYFLENSKADDNVGGLFERYWMALPVLGQAALTTIALSVFSMMFAILFGLMLALVRIYGPTFLSKLVVIYIELIRGTPLLIQLIFIYYGLPKIGISMHPWLAAILGLGLNYAAYEAENYRAGLFSVPRGQMEASVSLGMTRKQSLRHVIIPQAIRLVIPPMTNDFISLIKDSSLVSLIAIIELTKLYSQMSSATFDYIGPGILVAVIYLLLGLPFVRLARWTEAKYSIYKSKEDENRLKL